VESLHRAVGTVGARSVVPAASAALVRVGAGRRPRATRDDRAATGQIPPNRERGKRAVAAPRAAVTLVRLAEINAAGKICAAARRHRGQACREKPHIAPRVGNRLWRAKIAGNGLKCKRRGVLTALLLEDTNTGVDKARWLKSGCGDWCVITLRTNFTWAAHCKITPARLSSSF